MKEWIMNTSWSFALKARCGCSFGVQVGCDVLAYVIPAGAVNTQLMRLAMRVAGE